MKRNKNCNIHKLVADVTVLAEKKVLLVKYKDTKQYNNDVGWFLPDDLLRELEHPEIAAKRILKEQVGLVPKKLILSHIESFRGNDKTWHMTFHYKTKLTAIPKIKPGKNIKELEWFSLQYLPKSQEVSHHGWALGTIKRATTNV